MSLQIQLKKSAVSQKQPFASDLAVGELALNYNADGPFLTCKDTAGNIRKLNNVWVAATAPTNPTVGDLWLDTNLTVAVLKVYKDSTSTWVNATTIPVATTSIFGTVRLATSADITNGTSGKVVDAAQLQSKITDLLSNDVILNGDLEVNGDLTVNGTTTTIDTETLIVEDKNIEMGVVATPTDNTADGGGITLKGATDKTLNWVNATDSWTSSENLDLASGKSYRINGTEVLSATALGSAVQISSANIPNGTIVDSDINVAAEIAVSKLADGDARQLLQTDAAGTGVEWTSNVDVPGTLDVTGAATFDSSVSVTGALTKSGNNVVTVGDTGTVTSTMIANNTIVNEDINASAAIADTKLDTISTAGKVSNSATTATSANTASAIVARDASGNFTAGTVTASLAGNADTATKLNSTRTFAVTGDVTGTVSSDLTSGATIATSIASGVIVDADINASAEIAVSKLADGDARQLLQTDAAGTGVEWTSNVDVPGTLDVTGATTLDSTLGVTGVISANGKVSFPLGSAAAPSLYPGSDTDTGIYSPGANELAISTNGTGRLFVDSSGKVGVGTALPATNLHIRSTGTPILRIQDDDGTGQYSDFYNSAGQSIYNAVNGAGVKGAHIFLQAGTEAARIDTSGRLGLGTSSPDVGLHYRGDQPKLRIESSNELGTAAGTEEIGRLEWEGFRNTNFNAAASIRARQDGTWSTNTAWLSPTALEFYTQDNTGVEVTSPRLTIDSTGRVGIGTTSPGVALHVDGDIRADGIYGETDTNTSIQFPGSDVITFNEGGSEAARIDSSGRLLVGTSSALAPGGITPQIQLEGTSAGDSSVVVKRNSNDAGRPIIYFAKSRGTTKGSNTIVQSDDILGSLLFAGADGSDIVSLGAEISAQVDGTPGTDDMPGRLVFSTTADGASSPTERMRISSAGTIDINTGGQNVVVTSGTTDGATFYDTSGGAGVIHLSATTSSLLVRRRLTDGNAVVFYRDTTSVGTISVTTTATAYNTSSDYRLKENVAPVTDGITRLQQLKPSRFNFIADPDKTVDGFLAHEVQTIVPEAITGEKDAVDDEGNPQYQGIDQSKLVPLLTAALQEAIGEIESLKARVAALETP